MVSPFCTEDFSQSFKMVILVILAIFCKISGFAKLFEMTEITYAQNGDTISVYDK